MGPLHGLPVSLKVSARWKCSIRPLLTVYSSQGFIQPEGHSSNNWICIIHQPPTSRFQLSTRGDLAQGRSRALRQDQSSSDFDDGRLREQCVWPNTGNWPSKHRYAHFIDRLQNPYKLNLTAGGSSGGEGALVGMGVPLGCWNRYWWFNPNSCSVLWHFWVQAFHRSNCDGRTSESCPGR